MWVEKQLVGPLFLQAASSGNVQDVMRLRARLPSIESQREICYEALQFAAQNGHASIVKELLAIAYNFSYFSGLFFEVKESGSSRHMSWCFYGAKMLSSPLHLAVKEGHVEAVQEIVNFFHANKVLDYLFDNPSDATQEFLMIWFQCLLEWAVRWGHAFIVQLLLTGPPFLIPSTTGHVQRIDRISLPVHLAAHHKHLDALQVLLGAAESNDFNELRLYSDDGLTALHLAAQSGSLPIVEFLLNNAKMDVNVRSYPDLFTPLHMAANCGHEEVVRFLLKSLNLNPADIAEQLVWKVDLLARDSMGRTALHYAAREGHQNVVEVLLNCTEIGTADIADLDGLLALHMAARGGHVQIVRDLKRHSGGVDSTSGHRSKMRSCFKRVFMEKLNNLDKKFPRPSQIDSLFWKTEGFTPLHFAARYGHEAVVRELLEDTEIKANLHLQDHAGFLAFDWMEVHNKGEVFLNSMVGPEGSKDGLKKGSCMSKMTTKKRSRIAKDIEEEKQAMEEIQHAWEGGTRPQISMPILRWLMNADDKVEVNIAPLAVDALSALTLALSEGSFWMAKEILLLEPTIVFDYHVSDMVKQLLRDASGKLDQETLDFVIALVTSDKLAGASNLLRWMLPWAQRKNELGLVDRILERPDLKRGLYEDRQVYVDCANAILVGAALIAGVAFQGWLQPPLGYSYTYGGEGYAMVHKGAVRMFWRFNNAAFFFSVGTLIAGAKGAVPVAHDADIVVSVEKVKRAVAIASTLLATALVCVAFVCAGLAVLPPIASDLDIMYTSVGWGATICAVALLWFIGSVWPLLLETVRYSFHLILRPFVKPLTEFSKIAALLWVTPMSRGGLTLLLAMSSGPLPGCLWLLKNIVNYIKNIVNYITRQKSIVVGASGPSHEMAAQGTTVLLEGRNQEERV